MLKKYTFFQKLKKIVKKGKFTEISKIVKKGRMLKQRMECIIKIILLARDPERMAAMARAELEEMPVIIGLDGETSFRHNNFNFNFYL